jgi:hypothetical protein
MEQQVPGEVEEVVPVVLMVSVMLLGFMVEVVPGAA